MHAMKHHKGTGRPHWDFESRELTFQSIVLKRFHHTAPNQELLLQTFEEQGWSRFVDDPLPRTADISPEQRLRDTIKQLNRTIVPKLIKFHTDGRGKRVLWCDLSRLEKRAQH